jgi:hypothetical protein
MNEQTHQTEGKTMTMPRTPMIVVEADEDDVPRVASLDNVDLLEWADIAHRLFLRALGIEEVDDSSDTDDDDDPERPVRDDSAVRGFEWVERIAEGGRLTIRADGRTYSFDPKRWPDDDEARAWLVRWVTAHRLEEAAIAAVRAGNTSDPAVRQIVERDRAASRRTRMDRMQIQHEGAAWDACDPFVWGNEWGSLDLDAKRRIVDEGNFVHPDGRVFSPLDREIAAAEIMEEAERDARAFARRVPVPTSGATAAPAAPARPKVTPETVEAKVRRFVRIADEAGEPLNTRGVRERVGGRGADVDAALKALVERGELTTEDGPKRSKLYRIAKADEK